MPHEHPRAHVSYAPARLSFSLIAALARRGRVLEANDWPEWRGPRSRRHVHRDQPAGALVAGRRERRLVAAVRRPIDARHLRQPAVSADDRRTATSRRRRSGWSRSMSTRGKVVWERTFSLYLSDVPQHRAGWASPAVDPATGNIYMFTVGAELLALCAGRQAAVGSLAARRVRRDHDARRPHDVADHRGRQGHPEHADSELGTGSRPAGQPLLRVRQADRPDDLGELAAGAPLRHELLDADRGRRQRRAADDRRRHRRRVPRAAGQHRQAGVEPRGQQARDSQQRAVPRQHRLPHARRREHRHDRDGHGRRDRRDRQRPAHRQPRSSG